MLLKDRAIHRSLDFVPKGGLPLLTDFGEARLGDKEHNDDIMPNVYSAPEVIRKSNWGYEVVSGIILNFGFTRNANFGICRPGTSLALAPLSMAKIQMVYLMSGFIWQTELVALLGPPPPKFREQRHLCSVSWDESGNWKDLGPIPDISLESLTEKVEGENKGCLSHGCIY